MCKNDRKSKQGKTLFFASVWSVHHMKYRMPFVFQLAGHMLPARPPARPSGLMPNKLATLLQPVRGQYGQHLTEGYLDLL